MSRPKIHHFVPKSILRNFSIDNLGQKIWVFDKKANKTYPESIQTAGGEKYFNRVVVDGKGINFEGVFDQADSDLPNILGRITKSQKLSTLDETERDTLSLLAAIQFLRVKVVRESVRALQNQLRDLLIEMADSSVNENSIPLANDNDARAISLSLLQDANGFAEHLRSKELTLYKAPEGCEFWISDSPIVRKNHFPGGDLGLGSRGVEIFWPISSNCAISFRCPSIRRKTKEESIQLSEFLASEPTLLCRPQDVDWMNTLQVKSSIRFLYGSSDNFTLAKSILQESKPSFPNMIHMSPMGTMPKKQGMPPGVSLLASGRETEHICPILSWENREGVIYLDISDDQLTIVENLLKDGPFQSIEIHENDGPGAGMRNVNINRASDSPLVLQIEHSDPALSQLMRQIDRGR